MKRFVPLLLACTLCSSPALAGDPSRASHHSVYGSAKVVAGSAVLAGVGSVVVVHSVLAVGDGVRIVLKGGSELATASIEITGEAAKGLSLAVGDTVSVVAHSTGHMLVSAGKALAFIPNEVGTSLLHQSLVAKVEGAQ